MRNYFILKFQFTFKFYKRMEFDLTNINFISDNILLFQKILANKSSYILKIILLLFSIRFNYFQTINEVNSLSICLVNSPLHLSLIILYIWKVFLLFFFSKVECRHHTSPDLYRSRLPIPRWNFSKVEISTIAIRIDINSLQLY